MTNETKTKAEAPKESSQEKETKKPTTKKETAPKTAEKKEVKETLKEAVKKAASKPAVAKETKKAEKKEVIELEREYIIPLRKEILKAQKFRKAKKATKAIKEFLAKHMKVEDRDTRLVKIDPYLNEEVWQRGMHKPLTKIKVKAVKKDGIVYAELAEVPDYVKFKIARDKRRHAPAKVDKAKAAPVAKAEETVEEKKETEEKEKASQEAGKAAQKSAANTAKHTTSGAHKQKTQPQRKVLK